METPTALPSWGETSLRRLELVLDDDGCDTQYLPADETFPVHRLRVSHPQFPLPPALFFFVDDPGPTRFDAETRLLRLVVESELTCRDAEAASQLASYLDLVNSLLPAGSWSHQAESGLLLIRDTLYFAPAHFNPRVVNDVLGMHRYYWEQFSEPLQRIASHALSSS